MVWVFSTNQGSPDSDDDSGDDEKANETPGDYPGVDDIDEVEERRLWTKLAGGAMAETGLAAPRVIRNEERDRAAGQSDSPWKTAEAPPAIETGPEQEDKGACRW